MVTGFLMLLYGVINKIFSSQYGIAPGNHANSGGAADNQDHAQRLRATAALFQFRLVAFGHITDRNQRAEIVIQPHFTQPEPADVRRDNKLRNNMIFYRLINGQPVEGSAIFLIDEPGLCRVRYG